MVHLLQLMNLCYTLLLTKVYTFFSDFPSFLLNVIFCFLESIQLNLVVILPYAPLGFDNLDGLGEYDQLLSRMSLN